MEERALLEAAGRGDAQAFATFVRRTRDSVWRYLLAHTRDPGAAEDALQETYVALWTAARSYRGEAPPRAFLFGLARRHAARTFRQKMLEPLEDAPLIDLGLKAGWGQDPERTTQALEDHERVHRALDRLSADDREVLGLVDLEGLSGPEAALVLGITPEATRVRVHRARLRLMGALREEEVDHVDP